MPFELSVCQRTDSERSGRENRHVHNLTFCLRKPRDEVRNEMLLVVVHLRR